MLVNNCTHRPHFAAADMTFASGADNLAILRCADAIRQVETGRKYPLLMATDFRRSPTSVATQSLVGRPIGAA
jgi:hypothetical protein